MKKEYYYIRTEGYSGNSLIWWRPNSQGYTSNLNNAGKYTKEKAEIICNDSKTEVAYKCEKIDNLKKGLMRTVHSDYLQISEADINKLTK